MNFFLFALIIVLFLVGCMKEHFAATSPGTLLQLRARGPQDTYLTGYPISLE